MEVLARLNQTCRKFINVIAQGVTILAYKNNLVFLFSIDTVNDHAIRIISPGLQFQCRDILGSGCHIIRYRSVMNACGIHMIQIDKTVICHFFYIMNLSHGFSSFPHNSVNAPESVSLKDNTNSFINKEYDHRNQNIFK